MAVSTAVNTLVRHTASGWSGRVWNFDPTVEYAVYVMFNAAQGFGECYTEAEFQDKFEEVAR
jgi:hypothetical protein